MSERKRLISLPVFQLKKPNDKKGSKSYKIKLLNDKM